MSTEDAALPLSGIRVVELGHSVAAPYAALILAELGAEVVKIEKPGKGDDARHWGPPFHEGTGTIFHSLNRQKKSVVVDLADPTERAKLKDYIVQEADVFIQNMRPGSVEKMGFGAEDLTAANPRLIHVSLGAFGDKGPMSRLPGYDPLLQAFGGIMSVTGEEGRPPVRVGTSILDMGSGLWVVIGVLAALLRRSQTGKGGAVGTSLFETAIAWMLYHVASHSLTGLQPVREGSGSPYFSPYYAYQTGDGLLMIACGNDNQFRKLCDVLGHPELVTDKRFATNPDRVINKEVLKEILHACLASDSSSGWAAKFGEVGVPCAPIQGVGQVVSHPQTMALDILRQSPDGALRFVGLPLTFDGVRPNRSEPAPALGADTESVLGAPRPDR